MSQQNLFWDSEESTSSPADSPAPTSARQERAWDSSEESAVPYGFKCSASSSSSGRLGSSLRTFLLSTLEGLTPFSLVWRMRATPRGRWWWVLGRSARHTGGIESGSLGGEWGTPDAERASATMMRGNPTLLGAAREPGEWPTPSATPCGTSNNGSPRDGYREAYATAGKPSLEGCAREEWPTPTARDFRSIHASPETMARNARPLSETVGAGAGLDGPLAASNPSTPGNPPASSSPAGGYLNPAWVEALMGAPPGWTELPEEIARELYARRASSPGAGESG